MGEVIYLDFENKKPVEKEQPKSESVKKIKIDEKESDKIDHYAKFTRFMLSEGVKKLARLRVSPNSLHKSREIARKYSTGELIDWLEKTNENDWKKKAAFFQTIFAELRDRLDMK